MTDHMLTEGHEGGETHDQTHDGSHMEKDSELPPMMLMPMEGQITYTFVAVGMAMWTALEVFKWRADVTVSGVTSGYYD